MPRLVIRVVLLSAAILSLVTFPAVAQSNDEAAVRALVEQYYQLYAQKDVNGILHLWSEQAPAYKATKPALEKQFTAPTITVKSVSLSRVQIEGDNASLRATVEMARQTQPDQAAQSLQQRQNFRLVRAENRWKVWQSISAFDELAAALDAAATEEARAAVLSVEPTLLTPDLVDPLAVLATNHYKRGNFAQARLLAQLGLRITQERGWRRGQAVFANIMANIFYQQSDYAQSSAFMKQSLQIHEELGNKLNISMLVNNLGAISAQLGDYDLALGYFQKGLSVRQELGDKAAIAQSLANLGGLCAKQGNHEQSLNYFEQCLKLREAIGEREGMADVRGNMATIYNRQGRYRQALTSLLSNLKTYQELDLKPDIILALAGLGNVYSSMGHLEQALAYYQKALKLAEEIGVEVEIAGAWNNIGNIYHEQGQWREARECFEKALKIQEKRGIKDEAAESLHNIGTTYFTENHFEQALEYLQRALKIKEELNARVGIAESLLTIGEVQYGQRQYPLALETFLRAERLATEINLPAVLWSVQTQIGNTLRRLKQPESAQQSYQKAIRTIEALRQQVAGSAGQQASFLANKTVPYFALTDLLLAQKQAEPAFILAEQAKARVLLDSLQGGPGNVQKALLPAEQQDERDAQAYLTKLNLQVIRETQTPKPNLPKVADLKTQMEKARLEYEALETRLYLAHPELKVRRGEVAPLAVADTAALLDNKTALLEFAVGEEKAHLFVITLRDGQPALQTFALPLKRKELAAKTELLRQYLATKDLRYSQPARELYDLLLKPAAAQLLGKTRLVIVPDGPLWELPFQALMPADNHFLIEEKTISTAPSLTFLREMVRLREKRGKAASPNTILAVGNPALGNEMLAQGAALMGDKLEPLPFAEQQAIQLGQLYKTNAKILLGAAATEQAVKAEMGKHRILHLATHGVLDDRNPMYSHLVLAQTGTSEKEDGLLEARELLEMDLQADLAVLSACETGRGKIGAGEGMIGLTWALFVAGVPSTVVSQWKVADKSTAELMVEFHKQLQAKNAKGERLHTKAEALRQAALMMLKQPNYRHPFHWASFVLVGDGF